MMDTASTESLKDWIEREQVSEKLDTVIKATAREFRDSLSGADFEAAAREVLKLKAGQGADCDYSRTGVGLLYLLAWQGKRIHNSIELMSQYPDVYQSDRIVDFGAGCGAAMTAASLLRRYYDSRNAASQTRPCALHPIEPSPEMTRLICAYWSRFCKVTTSIAGPNGLLAQPIDDSVFFPMTKSGRTWVANRSDVVTSVIASYPFATSDVMSPDTVVDTLVRVVTAFKAQHLLVWTSREKQAVLEKLRKALGDEWTDAQRLDLQRSSLSGPLAKTKGEYYHQAMWHRERDGIERFDEHFSDEIHWGGAQTVAATLALVRRSNY